jgi:hypothetical protein
LFAAHLMSFVLRIAEEEPMAAGRLEEDLGELSALV